ncbi:hypothetical protein Q5530_29135 [Saccharothrix sp. BKS2]|uniref:hypothetical protein n=1 Tax=Saccharothrix sp. BKS2 TaxID=3064400 RepID=UPI0039EB3918
MEHWWRVTVVSTAVALGVFAAGVAPTVLFGVVPVLVWCADPRRSRRVGVPVGVVLLVLLAWFALPHGLGWSGRWVPSAAEVCWLYPLSAAVVCLVGARVERRPAGCVPWAVVLCLGFALALGDLVLLDESPPGNEGVLPGPVGLRAVEADPVCGSGGCARVVGFGGDRAAVRAHLGSRGFTTPSGRGGGWVCRVTGVVVERRACAGLRERAGVVEVTWYVG